MHAEPQAGFPAFMVWAFSILIFHGSVYLVVALNLGWRFGYWVTGAVMGGLMVFLSVFWVTNALGPQGEPVRWYAVGTANDTVPAVEFGETTYTSPSTYPEAPWKPKAQTKKPDGTLEDHPDVISLKATFSNCLTFTEDAKTAEGENKIEDTEHEIEAMSGFTRNVLEGRFGKKDRSELELQTCKTASTFLMDPDDPRIPKVDGRAVSVIYDVANARFTTEGGVELGEATIQPNVYDKRVTDDPEGLRAMKVGDEFKLVSYEDPGSLRYPSYLYILLSGLWLAFHLWGLNRAEKRKLTALV